MNPMNDGPPLERAIVCDDGTSAGAAALSAARYLMDGLGVDAHVIHAVDVPDPSVVGGDPAVELERRRNFESQAGGWLEGRAAEEIGPGIHTSVGFGRPARVIQAAVEEHNADLVIVGPHTKEHMFDFGGTQRAVFGGTSCHVWSQPGKLGEIERILCPTDLSPLSMQALDMARAMARALTLPLHVIHASEPPVFSEPGGFYGGIETPAYVVESLHDAAEKRFASAMDAYDFEDVPGASRAFHVGPPVPVIEDARQASDLVILGTRGHTGLGAALLGGTAYAVLKAGTSPVLAVRGQG